MEAWNDVAGLVFMRDGITPRTGNMLDRIRGTSIHDWLPWSCLVRAIQDARPTEAFLYQPWSPSAIRLISLPYCDSHTSKQFRPVYIRGGPYIAAASTLPSFHLDYYNSTTPSQWRGQASSTTWARFCCWQQRCCSSSPAFLLLSSMTSPS